MSNVITLIFNDKRRTTARRPRSRPAPVDVVTLALAESGKAGPGVKSLARFPVLDMLAWLARVAPDRARSVSYGGVRFPLHHGLCMRVVACPRTGRKLVATVTL